MAWMERAKRNSTPIRQATDHKKHSQKSLVRSIVVQ